MNETYIEHFKCAFLFGSTMLIGGIACIIHAIFPFLFEKTGSNFLLRMMNTYIERMPQPEGRVTEITDKLEKRFCRGKG